MSKSSSFLNLKCCYYIPIELIGKSFKRNLQCIYILITVVSVKASLLSSITDGLLSSLSIVSGVLSGDETLQEGISDGAATLVQTVAEGTLDVVTTQCKPVKELLGVSFDEAVNGKEPDVNNLTLVLRTTTGNYTYNINEAEKSILSSGAFNISKKTVIFIHGFTDNPDKNNFLNISNSFLAIGYNTIALDSSSLIGELYLRSTTYCVFIGLKLGKILAALYNNGLPLKNLLVVGHSLGAHIAGYTGKSFYNLTKVRLPRITGLDPAGPCFLYMDDAIKLNKTDADFVDIIHTNAGVYGIDENIGVVDYWPNGGSLQPGCVLPTCQHSRAVLLYAESVLLQKNFPAKKCLRWSDFLKDRCNETDVSYMGFLSNANASGAYFLTTNSAKPYGMGEEGLQ